MEAQSHLDYEGLKHVFSKLLDMIPMKIIIATLFTGISWVFDGKVQILATIYILIFLDTFTGVWFAVRQKTVSSRGFYRVITKCFAYFIMIVVGRLVDKNIPLPLAAPIIDAFLVTTEAVSILENLGKLQFPIPMALITKLKSFYENKKEEK